MSSQLTELREYFATCFHEIIGRQTRMEERQTRMEDRQTRMEERQTRMEEQQTRMEVRQGALEKEVREIGRTLRRINLDLATALRNQDERDDRLTELETQPSQL
jgi:hypothetical protein